MPCPTLSVNDDLSYKFKTSLVFVSNDENGWDHCQEAETKKDHVLFLSPFSILSPSLCIKKLIQGVLMLYFLFLNPV